jgi:hypothetical protein
MLLKENGSKSRLVVTTQGSEPVLAVQHGEIIKFSVDTLAKDDEPSFEVMRIERRMLVISQACLARSPARMKVTLRMGVT